MTCFENQQKTNYSSWMDKVSKFRLAKRPSKKQFFLKSTNFLLASVSIFFFAFLLQAAGDLSEKFAEILTSGQYPMIVPANCHISSQFIVAGSRDKKSVVTFSMFSCEPIFGVSLTDMKDYLQIEEEEKEKSSNQKLTGNQTER